jgi:hypothetical protein
MTASGVVMLVATGRGPLASDRASKASSLNTRPAVLGLAIALLALAASPASAQQWQSRVTANAELRYDDNVRLTIEDTESSLVSSLRAAGHAIRRTENTSLDIAGGVSSNTYSDASDLDNPAAFVRLDSRFRTERSEYSLDLLADTQSTLTSEAATSGLTQVNKQRYQFVVSPEWSYLVTERASVNLGLNYRDVFYEDVSDTPLYDYQVGTLILGGGYRLSERAGLDLRLDYGQFKADRIDTEYDNIGAQLGANYLLTETWSLNFLAGLRRTEARFTDFFGDRLTQESTGPTYALNLRKRFDRGGGLDFGATRELAPSGTAEVLDTTSLTFRVVYPFTERWRVGLNANGYRNRQPDGESSLADRKYAQATLRLTYRLQPAWTLAAGYRYRWQNRDEVPGDAESNAVFLTLAWDKNWGS